MINADEVRKLMYRPIYEELVKEYEEKIEKDILQAAKDGMNNVVIKLQDEDPLFEKCLYKALENFVENDFEVKYSRLQPNEFMVFVSW